MSAGGGRGGSGRVWTAAVAVTAGALGAGVGAAAAALAFVWRKAWGVTGGVRPGMAAARGGWRGAGVCVRALVAGWMDMDGQTHVDLDEWPPHSPTQKDTHTHTATTTPAPAPPSNDDQAHIAAVLALWFGGGDVEDNYRHKWFCSPGSERQRAFDAQVRVGVCVCGGGGKMFVRVCVCVCWVCVVGGGGCLCM